MFVVCLLFCLWHLPSTGVGVPGEVVRLVLVWSLLGVCLSFVLWAPLLFFGPVLWSCFSVPWRSSCLSVRVFLFLFFRALALFLFFCSWSFVLCFPLLFFRSLLPCSCSSVPVLPFFSFCPLACSFVFSATSLSTTTRLFETQILPFCDFFSFIILKTK